jgi:hypothetical protein
LCGALCSIAGHRQKGPQVLSSCVVLSSTLQTPTNADGSIHSLSRVSCIMRCTGLDQTLVGGLTPFPIFPLIVPFGGIGVGLANRIGSGLTFPLSCLCCSALCRIKQSLEQHRHDKAPLLMYISFCSLDYCREFLWLGPCHQALCRITKILCSCVSCCELCRITEGQATAGRMQMLTHSPSTQHYSTSRLHSFHRCVVYSLSKVSVLSLSLSPSPPPRLTALCMH